MTIAHVASVGHATGELAELEAQIRCLREELAAAQRKTRDAQHAGNRILGALESAMAPLMEELSAAKRASGDVVPTNGTLAESESEVDHLKLDIDHYREQVYQLQVQERQRNHELKRLRSEVAEASDLLAYEQRRLHHLELCRKLNGNGLQDDSAWGGLGPMCIGKRTIEVRSEQRLRESAEQRGGKLSRDVTKLTADAARYQATIMRLSQRLSRVRTSFSEKDGQLTVAAKQTADLQSRITKVVQAADPELAMALDLADLDNLAKELARTSVDIDTDYTRKEKKQTTRSTGKLPALSF